MKRVVLGPMGPTNSASGLAQKIVSFPKPMPVFAPAPGDKACKRHGAVILAFPAPVAGTNPVNEPRPKSRWDMARDLIDRVEARHRAAAALRRERVIRRAIERSKGTRPGRHY